MQVRMAIEVETMLPTWIRKRCIATSETIYPNAYKTLQKQGEQSLLKEFLEDCGVESSALGENDDGVQNNFQQLSVSHFELSHGYI